MTMLLPLLAFVFASLIVAAVGMRFAGARGTLIDRRLAEVTGGRPVEEAGPRFAALKETVRKLGSKVPVSPSEVGKVRLRLIQAGYRGAEALPIFVGIRISVAIAAFILFATPLVLRPNVSIGLGVRCSATSSRGWSSPGWRSGASTASSSVSPTRST
jgi:hypothetical protein